MDDQNKRISTILKHESKRNTYKIALVRAINDVVLEYSPVIESGVAIAIPLKLLAEFWFAYYWAFVDPQTPVRQGYDATDISFRAELTLFRGLWQETQGLSNSADGFFIKNMMTLTRQRTSYPHEIHKAYQSCVSKTMKALQQPIRYAGTGEYNLFAKPQMLRELSNVQAIPNTQPEDLCLVVQADLWETFQDLSMWVEALCIHEWCLFTETVRQNDSSINRGFVYTLLTARPDNRRPLTWERNHVDLLLHEGAYFICPWTLKTIRSGVAYDMDHIVPIAIRPINELWNLVPSDPNFNSHIKRDRLPSLESLNKAQPALIRTYDQYLKSKVFKPVLETDTQTRFGLALRLPDDLYTNTRNFVLRLTEFRNVAHF